MSFDFEVLLVVLTFVTGVVWGWDKWRQKKARARGEGQEGADDGDIPWWLDLSRSLFPVIIAVLIIRSFLVEPFHIPSGSMIPTLYPRDFILVNKFAYGVRLPVVHTKVLDVGAPERGDVAVFRYPVNPQQDFIKRIVGLPGDRIVYRSKQLYINGEAVPQESLGAYVGPEQAPDAVRLVEYLPGATHGIVVHGNAPDHGFQYQVPEGHYFVMGDNRDQSSDSRFWGPVPEDHLVGEAFIIWMSWNTARFRPNWDRIGSSID